MGKPYNRNNKDISKIYNEIVKDERRSSSRRLRLRAACVHPSQSADNANLIPKKQDDGTILWICRLCGEKMDLRIIPDERLKNAIQTITDACNFIKIMSSNSEKDVRLVDEVISDVQYKINAFIGDAYKAAKNSGMKRNQMRREGGYRSGGNSYWVEN